MARRSYEYSSAFKAPNVDMKALEKSVFVKGAKVEASFEYDDPDFRGAWFTAFVVTPVTTNGKVRVQYDELLTEDGKRKLVEWTKSTLLRPLAPREKVKWTYNLNQEVDLFHGDGWWEGRIIKVHGKGKNVKYSVFIRGPHELFKVVPSRIRLHREWLYGEWIPPLEEDEQEPAAADDDGGDDNDDDDDLVYTVDNEAEGHKKAGGGGDEAGGSGTK